MHTYNMDNMYESYASGMETMPMWLDESEQENKKLKERVRKAIEYEEEIMYLANKVAIITQNVEIKAIRDRLEEIFEILKGEE